MEVLHIYGAAVHAARSTYFDSSACPAFHHVQDLPLAGLAAQAAGNPLTLAPVRARRWVQDSASARLAALGREVGSGLMAADMAVMLAQKRQASLALADALMQQAPLQPKTLMAHR